MIAIGLELGGLREYYSTSLMVIGPGSVRMN